MIWNLSDCRVACVWPSLHMSIDCARRLALCAWIPSRYTWKVQQSFRCHALCDHLQFTQDTLSFGQALVAWGPEHCPHFSCFVHAIWVCPHWLHLKHCLTQSLWSYSQASNSWESMTMPLLTVLSWRAWVGRLIMSVPLVFTMVWSCFACASGLCSHLIWFIAILGTVLFVPSQISWIMELLSTSCPLLTCRLSGTREL